MNTDSGDGEVQPNDIPESGARQFAQTILDAQPVKGYPLSAILASSDRTAVFKSHDSVMDRPVVVKMMRPWPGREGIVEDFFSLAGSIARLRATGVARGLDVGRADGNFYLVYEFLTGESLEQKLQKRQTGRMTERESARLVRDIALLLQDLFRLGQPHGYLKPSNIMIADSHPRLADIGFAWNLAWPDDDAAFRAGARYLPPERLQGEINVDVRGDLYSLGAIWFRCVTGRDLFQGDDAAEMVRKHIEVRPPTAKSVDAKLTDETSKLIRWLLEKDRNARPRTPKEFLRRLALHPLLAGDAVDMEVEDGEELTELDIPDETPEEIHNETSAEPSVPPENVLVLFPPEAPAGDTSDTAEAKIDSTDESEAEPLPTEEEIAAGLNQVADVFDILARDPNSLITNVTAMREMTAVIRDVTKTIERAGEAGIFPRPDEPPPELYPGKPFIPF